jgi:uncharacterized protein (TIGR03067 family)
MAPLFALLVLVATADRVRLQGDWVMVEQTIPDGTVLRYPKGPKPIEHYNLHVRGDKVTLRYDWLDLNDEVEMTFSLNPAAGELDFVVVGCTFPQLKKGDARAPLYKFDGDTLVLCDADFKQRRPLQFKVGGAVRIYKFARDKRP